MTDPAYIDTSCLLKLLVPEAETRRLQEIVNEEDDVVVSALTHLESRTRLLAMRRGGSISYKRYRAMLPRLELLVDREPFRLAALPGAVFEIAVDQLKKRSAVHCRSLDRLHLAAMSTLGATRILTADAQQAKAARSLGFTIVAP